MDFKPQERDEFLRDDLQQLVQLAIREDLARGYDLTTVSVVPEGVRAEAKIVARVPGYSAGIELIPWIIEPLAADIDADLHVQDGDRFTAGDCLVTLSGDARDLLTCERTILNFLGRLCGIATWTQQFVQLVSGTQARLYDTRKTTPGWRRLEKYAVRCGGGHNHRSGLYDAILIKDNHLASQACSSGQLLSPSAAIEHARQFLSQQANLPSEIIIEVEVDTLEQFQNALTAEPQVILLDNMSLEQLREAVRLRGERAPDVELEASGGVNLSTIKQIADTGVDRISVGALTHSAINLDLGLDWSFTSAGVSHA